MSKYFSFDGRIRRTHYGLRLLLNVGISFMIIFLMAAGGLTDNPALLLVGFLLCIGGIWFGLAAAVQRCHDMDKSGWYSLIPVYGPIICLFVEGTRGSNKYGPDPKQQQPIQPGTQPVSPQPNYITPGNGGTNGNQVSKTAYAKGVYVDVENDPNQVYNSGAGSTAGYSSTPNYGSSTTGSDTGTASTKGGYKKGSLYN